MSVVKDKLNNLNRVILLLPSIILEALKGQNELIADLNRQQLAEGKDANNQSLPDYVPGSRQPSAPGPIKLFEFGNFYDGIEPKFDDQEVTLEGMDEKTGFLIAKYGEILGLTDESIRKLQIAVLPSIQLKIRSLL